MAIQVLAPSDLHSSVWNCDYQLLNHPVQHDKKFMPTKFTQGISYDTLLGTKNSDGSTLVPGMIDGLQVAGDYERSQRKGQIWVLGRNENASGTGRKYTDPALIAADTYNLYDKSTLIFAQFAEDCHCFDSFGTIEQPTFKKIFEHFRDFNGGTIDNTEIYGDYFQNLNGYGTSISVSGLTTSQAILGMSSEVEARKTNRSGEGVYFASYYYSDSCYDYMHRFQSGYQDGIAAQHDANGVFDLIYSLERQYISHAFRKVATFGWGSFEGVNARVESDGYWSAFPLASPAGSLIRLGYCESSYEMTRAQALYSLLIGDRYIMWNSADPYGQSEMCFSLPFQYDTDPWRVKWRDASGSVSQYNPANSAHPVRVCSSGQAGFSLTPAESHNAAWDAHYTYGQIFTYCNGSLKWPTYSYVENGTSKSGYYNGNVPVSGSLGSEVSRFSKANYGQCNIVNQYTNGKKPICFYGTGAADSSKHVAIVQNVNAGLVGATVYTINEGSGYTFTHYGTGVGVFILN